VVWARFPKQFWEAFSEWPTIQTEPSAIVRVVGYKLGSDYFRMAQHLSS